MTRSVPYEAPSVTTYGNLAELTSFDPVSGAAIGVPEMALSVAVPPGPPSGPGIDVPPPSGGATPPSAPDVPSQVSTAAVGAGTSAPGPGTSVAGVGPSAAEPGVGESLGAGPARGDDLGTPASGVSEGDGGGLPFTGGALGLLSAIGAALAGLGVALRRAVTRR